MKKADQNTTINFSRTEDGMTITTTDRTVMTKLDKLCESSEHYTLVNTETKGKEIVSKEYTCDDKTLLSFRGKKGRTMTEEEKKAAAERLRAAREKKEIPHVG